MGILKSLKSLFSRKAATVPVTENSPPKDGLFYADNAGVSFGTTGDEMQDAVIQQCLMSGRPVIGHRNEDGTFKIETLDP